MKQFLYLSFRSWCCVLMLQLIASDQSRCKLSDSFLLRGLVLQERREWFRSWCCILTLPWVYSQSPGLEFSVWSGSRKCPPIGEGQRPGYAARKEIIQETPVGRWSCHCLWPHRPFPLLFHSKVTWSVLLYFLWERTETRYIMGLFRTNHWIQKESNPLMKSNNSVLIEIFIKVN